MSDKKKVKWVRLTNSNIYVRIDNPKPEEGSPEEILQNKINGHKSKLEARKAELRKMKYKEDSDKNQYLKQRNLR